MSVVGFDIGNENCVIAVAKQRGIDVLLNDESNRETPSVVAFGEKQRFMGSAGAASATMHPKSTIYQVKRLLGRNFNDPSVQDDLRLLPFETTEGPDGGILIHLPYMEKKQTFTPVHILAMLLGHLKQITEKNLGMQIANCVIGIPSYSTDLQRRSYLHAAEIAGLEPLRLMHDSTAIGLGYGIYKTEFPNGGVANVLFVDVGHSDTQVAIISFRPGGMKVLSHAFDSNLGGRDFDEILFRHFASQFRELYKVDVYSSSRASLRLRASCEKLKKVLSANNEAPLNIECLMEEKDVKGFIRRDEFEKMASTLVERFSIPCQQAVRDSGLSIEKIHTVELVGSGSRVPAITKMLTSLFRKEPRRSLNASECVARGCAVQCAMLSPIFRSKEYEVEDSFPFSIAFTSDDVPICSVRDGVLFPKGNAFPSIKVLKLQRNDIFSMEAVYFNQNELPSGVSSRISSHKIGPFRVSHDEKLALKIKVQLNIHGIVTVNAASLINDHAEDSTIRNSNDTFSEDQGPNSQDSFGKSTAPFGHEMRRLTAVRRQDIFIDENIYGGMTQAELSQAREKELQLTQQDMKIERTKEKKNALEAYVYETRNKLLGAYRSFASDTEKERISGNLQQTEEWLYEEGEDESENVYANKLENLKKMLDPIDNRYKDDEGRALEIRNLMNSIVEFRSAAGNLPPRERDAIIGECNKAEQWLREKSQQQDSLPKNADPVLRSYEIKTTAVALEELYRRLVGSPPSRPEGAKESNSRSGRDDMQID